MVLPDIERAERSRPPIPRLLPLAAAAMLVIGGLSLFPSPDPPVAESLTDAPLLVNPSPVEVAETFMAVRNAYDIEKVMAMVADDAGTAPRTLRGAEFALVFEAEEVYGVRYQPFECGEDSDLAWAGGDASVTCTFLMDHKLSRIEGYPPMESSFRFRIREGRMALLDFPWLQVWWGGEPARGFPFAYYPAEFDNFLKWLETEHPESVEGFGEESESVQTVFDRTYRRLDLILTRESLDLLADYLEEYERLVNG